MYVLPLEELRLCMPCVPMRPQPQLASAQPAALLVENGVLALYAMMALRDGILEGQLALHYKKEATPKPEHRRLL